MTMKDNGIKEHHIDNDKNYANQSYNNKSNKQFVKINWWINELDSLGIKAKKIKWQILKYRIIKKGIRLSIHLILC